MMQAPSFTLNSDDARAGSGGGGRISDNGAYVGQITKAKHITAKTGATGIEFEFESSAGEGARFTLYTHKTDGTATYSFKQLQALMTILKQREIKPVQTMIEEYDYDAGQKVRHEVVTYPALMGKPVGIVFQMEDYYSDAGELKTRPNFYAPFDPVSKKLAIEILDNTPAGKLDKILATLKTKPAQQRAQAAPQGSGYTAPHGHSSTQSYWDGYAPPELDDLPF